MCSQPGITTFKWVFIQNREKCTLQSVQSVNLNVFKWTVCLPVGNSKELLFFVLFWEDSVEHRPFPLFVLCSMQGLFGPLGWPVTCLKLAQEPRCTGRGKMTSLESCDKYMVRKCKSVRRGERETHSQTNQIWMKLRYSSPFLGIQYQFDELLYLPELTSPHWMDPSALPWFYSQRRRHIFPIPIPTCSLPFAL